MPDPDRASEVDVRFIGEAAGSTRVEIEHWRFERHGEGGAEYRQGLASDQGWPYMLGLYAAAAGA